MLRSEGRQSGWGIWGRFVGRRQAEQSACGAGVGVGSGCAACQRGGHFPGRRQRRRGAVGERFGADVLHVRNRVGAVGFGAVDRERQRGVQRRFRGHYRAGAGGWRGGCTGDRSGNRELGGNEGRGHSAAPGIGCDPRLWFGRCGRFGARGRVVRLGWFRGGCGDGFSRWRDGRWIAGRRRAGRAGGQAAAQAGPAGREAVAGGVGVGGSGRTGRGCRGHPRRRQSGTRPDRRDGPGGGQPPAVPGHRGQLRREVLQPVVRPGVLGISRGQRPARPPNG